MLEQIRPQIISERPTAEWARALPRRSRGLHDRWLARSASTSSALPLPLDEIMGQLAMAGGACCEPPAREDLVRARARVALGSGGPCAWGLVLVTAIADPRWRDGWAMFAAAVLPVLLGAGGLRIGTGSDMLVPKSG
jgi:hypothetical protein